MNRDDGVGSHGAVPVEALAEVRTAAKLDLALPQDQFDIEVAAERLTEVNRDNQDL